MMGSQTEAMPTARSPLQQVPQPSEPATEPNGNGVLVPRVVLGIVCGLSLVNTMRSLIAIIMILIPDGFEVVGSIMFAMRRLVGILFPLIVAIPLIVLLIYAIRKRAVSSRAARVALIVWWLTWVVGFAAYLLFAFGEVPSDLFLRLILLHLASALAPAAATVCVILIQRGSEDSNRSNAVIEGGGHRSSPRIVLGIVVGIVLVGCAFGVLALVSSSMDQAQLAASGASGSEYLGSMVMDVIGVGFLAPAVPAILLMVFAVRPTRSTRTAAIVGLVLWWVLWVFAGFIMLPIQVGGIDAREALDLMWVFLALAIPPAVSTLCVHLASKGIRQGGVEGRMMR